MKTLDKTVYPVDCPKCLGLRRCRFDSLQDLKDTIDTLSSLADVLEKIDQDLQKDNSNVEEVRVTGSVCNILKYVRCGKANCKCSKESQGHGPYWYSYSRSGGKVKCKYVGKDLGLPGCESATSATAGRPSS
jgi:hypothetical protein